MNMNMNMRLSYIVEPHPSINDILEVTEEKVNKELEIVRAILKKKKAVLLEDKYDFNIILVVSRTPLASVKTILQQTLSFSIRSKNPHAIGNSCNIKECFFENQNFKFLKIKYDTIVTSFVMNDKQE